MQPPTQADHPLHRYPFVPRLFYFVPRQWLRDVATTGEFDARHLLLAMCDGSEYIAYPPDEREAAWTRNNDPRVPNVVSHVTYAQALAGLKARGWLAEAREERDDTEIYRLQEWPAFGGEGVIYAPRAYIRRRWPAWLGKNQWGPRAALTGLFAAATLYGGTDETDADAGPDAPVVIVTAGARRIAALARELLPALPGNVQPGLGLRMLADLGLVEEVVDARTARSAVFRFRTDALAREPGRWPAEQIARLCGLDATHDADWVALVQGFLAHNFKPVGDAPAVWATIRKYGRDVATPADARAALALLEELGRRPESGRRLTGVRRVLGEFIQRRAAGERWEAGPEFVLRLENGYAVAAEGLLPLRAGGHVLATQLVVSYERAGRLSGADAAELAASVRLYVRQGTSPGHDTLHMFLLRPPLSRPDRWAIAVGSVLDAGALHTRLDATRPFQIVVECARPSQQLVLRCRFRVLRSRRPVR